MPKTLIEKVTSPNPDVSIFRISGTLGFHENKVLSRFFLECMKKNITRLILDFSALSSLGGGCAKIIREMVTEGHMTICIAGASGTVEAFLQKEEASILYAESMTSGLSKIAGGSNGGPSGASSSDSVPSRPMVPATDKSKEQKEEKSSPKVPARPRGDDDDWFEAVASEVADHLDNGSEEAPASPLVQEQDEVLPNRELEKKLAHYRALLSLNSELNRINEKSKLLDAFLLTLIAQGGVESAVFLERQEDLFVPLCWKGFETADPDALIISIDDVDLDRWLHETAIHRIEESPVTDVVIQRLAVWDIRFAAPFIVYENLRGMVLLGRPIRDDLTDSALDFLSMLIKQASVSYANSCRFEEETERTLGLVQTLISMIEENTISRGNTDMLVHYVHSLAVLLHYPEEYLRDLMYGTVLRDIGMIKVSDLIVRSPRELLKEEWEIIKRHPIEGAEMLKNMRFSEHAQNVVLCHHERFNGEGYPYRLQGTHIPLGARVVSVVESYAAMLQDRPTRPALPREEALNTLKENWGLRYDPEVVTRFIEVVEEEIRSGRKVTYRGRELFKL